MISPNYTDATARFLEALRAHGIEPKRSGSGWASRCPAHEDRLPSLSISTGDDGRVLLRCHAGCTVEKITGDVGLKPRDLFAAPAHPAPTRRPTPATPPPAVTTPATDWNALNERFKAALPADKLAFIASDLNVSVDALKAINIGYASREDLKALVVGFGGEGCYPAAAFSFPERDGKREIVGFSFRAMDGRKGSPKGARRGLIVPDNLDDLPGAVLDAEGASDVAASITRGVAAVGRPSNASGAEALAELLPHREILVVGENDQKPDGRWPGRDGAIKTAEALARLLKKPVRWTMPPEGVKDIRAAFEGDIDMSASTLMDALEGNTQVIEPPKAETAGPDNRVIIDPRHTPPIARAFIESRYTVDDTPTLHHYAGEYLRHGGTSYAAAEDAAIRREVYGFLEHEAVDANGEPLKVNQHLVNGVVDALAAQAHLSASITAPAWIGDVQDMPPASEVIACKTRLLHLPAMGFLDPTPRFFTTSGLDFDPVADAPTPTRWLTFCDEIFGDDIEQLNTLQEIFGYLLTADTSQHKIILIVGPKRSGKGTIARVLTYLIGAANVAGPTTSSLAGAFGLQTLIGKSLAIISDARFRGEGVHTTIERLLAISGEDAITIDRKHREAVTAKLPVRFLILSNELPRLADASAAIASRFLILTLKRSFYGKEDPNLTRDLLAELPGVFLWAVEGWRRLQARGRFIQPQAGAEAQRQIEDLASPVGAFVREVCEAGPGCRVWCDDLFDAWKRWCDQEGRDMKGTRQSFGRDLSAVVPGVTTKRGTGNLRFYAGIGISDQTTAANRRDGFHCDIANNGHIEHPTHIHTELAIGTVAEVRGGAPVRQGGGR